MGRVAFGFQHIDDLLRGINAEQLTVLLLLPGDAVLFNQSNEITWRIARQCRAAKIRIRGQKMLRHARLGW